MERCCVQAVTALHSGGFNAVAKAGKRVPHNSLATWAARWKSGSCSCLTAGSSVIYLDWWAFCIKCAWSPHVFVCEAYFWKIYFNICQYGNWFNLISYSSCLRWLCQYDGYDQWIFDSWKCSCLCSPTSSHHDRPLLDLWLFKKKSLCESCRFVFLVPRNSQKT